MNEPESRRFAETASAARTRAAEILGMGGTTLWRKMKKYGLDEEARGLSE